MTMTTERILRIAKVELTIVVRDPLPVVLSIVMPLLFIYFLLPVYGGSGNPSALGQVVPGFTIMFAFFLLGNIGFVFFREHDWGTWDRLLTSSASLAEIIVGKCLVPFAVFAAQFALVTLGSMLLFGLRIDGSVLTLVLSTASFAAFLVALGVVIVGLSTNLLQVTAVSNLAAPVLSALGGALVPVQQLPSWAQVVAPFSPAYWAMEGMQCGLVGGCSTLEAGTAVLALLLSTTAAVVVIAVTFRPASRSRPRVAA